MPTRIIMPRLDKDMEKGQIAAWHRSEGDHVEQGELLFEIETDKAAVEVTADEAGYLHHIAVKPGENAKVETAVAWLYAEGETVGEPPVEEAAISKADKNEEAGAKPLNAADLSIPATENAAAHGRIAATPAAIAEAHARGIALETVTPTGPSARVQKSDILAAAASECKAQAEVPSPVHAEDQAGPLSVVSSGTDGRLPVVMIHGFLADASGWEKLTRAIGPKRRIHCIELPCHGRSPNRRLTSFAHLVSHVREAFDRLDIDRCHLVGHSLGGALALALADTRPRKTASLTLISPAGLGPEINGEAIFGMCRASRSESLGPWMKLLTSNPDTIGWSYVQAAAASRRDAGLRAAQTAMADVLFPDGVQAFDLRSALDRLVGPARIIWGRDDRIIPWKHAMNAPGHVSLNLFHGVGHMPHYEDSGQVERFLAELP